MNKENISQVFEKSTGIWIKYNNKTGKVIERSINDKPFENVKIQTTVLKPKTKGCMNGG